jgi:hypothetical protein
MEMSAIRGAIGMKRTFSRKGCAGRSALRSGALLLALIDLSACGGSPTGPSPVPDAVHSGSWYRTGFHWPHDGNPYESEHFIVYSDAASLAARQQLAGIAEDLLALLSADFGISDTMFRWPPGQSKIHIYTFRDHNEPGWGGWGYYGGLMIYSLDHPIRGSLGGYSRVVTHELMHAVEGLLKGSDDPNLVDVWLTEGIAEHVAGGTQRISSVTSRAQLDELVARFGALNPIAMHRYEYPDGPDRVRDYYYVMFELSVEYLLDPAGHGRPKSGIRDIYLDVRNGVPFARTFEDHMAIGLQDYEDRYWNLIREYLR